VSIHLIKWQGTNSAGHHLSTKDIIASNKWKRKFVFVSAWQLFRGHAYYRCVSLTQVYHMLITQVYSPVRHSITGDAEVNHWSIAEVLDRRYKEKTTIWAKFIRRKSFEVVWLLSHNLDHMLLGELFRIYQFSCLRNHKFRIIGIMISGSRLRAMSPINYYNWMPKPLYRDSNTNYSRVRQFRSIRRSVFSHWWRHLSSVVWTTVTRHWPVFLNIFGGFSQWWMQLLD